MNRKFWTVLTLLLIAALIVVACSGGEAADTNDQKETAPQEEAATEEPAKEEVVAEEPATKEEAAAVSSVLERAEAGEFDGTEVNIFTVWGDDAESGNFEATLADFAERTGINIVHEGSADFETLITVRVEGGDAPDIAVFPQPALMASFVQDGTVVDLESFMDLDKLHQNYSQGLLDLGTVDGQLSGIFIRASTKSLVWYPVPEFEEAGYAVPETWDELIALSDQMVTDGNTPWCISIEHSGATGWVATDWVEDVLLRTAGADVYDKWIAHDIPFNDPAVKEAAEVVAEIWFNPDYVYGGTTSILTTFVGDTQTPMFDEAGPQCWMHRQAGWIPAFFPEGEEAGTDSAFFYLPPIKEEHGKPVLGGGDAAAMFNDRPEVQAVMEYMASPEAFKGWVEAGGFISPNKGVSLDWYPSDVDRTQAEILQNASTLRFDASDLMPAEVGTGTFWTGMVDWISGDDLDTVLQAIEDSWPTGETGVESSGDMSSDDDSAYEYIARAEAGEFDGTEVNIFTVWGDDVESGNFEATLADFAERTGINIVHEGSADFETLITVRVEGGDAPDIAVFPQPALMASFVQDGAVVDLESFMNVDKLHENYSQGLLDLGTVDGQLSGIFIRASTKSLVWYPVPEFEEAGYTVPETWDELIALSDQMVADGNTPWCISIEHSGATGWVATDWVEDVLLRTAGADVYDQWIAHEIPFNDPAVKEAAEVVAEIWFNPDYVYGGTTSILTTFVGDTQTPMFDEAGPQCWMHRQAGWIPAFFPEGEEAGTDSAFFYLPPIKEEHGKPVLGGGDAAAMFNDRPEVQAVMEYLSTAAAFKGWVEAGGFISPNKGVSLDWYPSDVDRTQAEILQNASTLRFDASDLMPAEVGTGTFWTGMVDWISGDDLDTVLQAIEDSWPTGETGVESSGDMSSDDDSAATDSAAYEFLAQAEAGDFSGTEIDVFTVWGDDAESGNFELALADFEERTGIDVVHEGSADFETLIVVRVEGGDAPDVAIFPQPALMASFVEDGHIVDLGSFMDLEQLKNSYSEGLLDLGTVDGQLSGIFYRASTKSLVWYPVPQFEEAGYTVPETWDELIALSDQMVADGNIPWCISIEHSGATGWVATDWIEDVLLRTAGADVYDQWVAHEIPFNDLAIKEAAEVVAEIWFNPDYVYGGTTSILTTFVGDTQTPMFDDAGPQCWLHRQAGWIPSFFPEGKKAGTDSAFFYLPPIKEEHGKPVLGGGDAAAMFNDRPEVRAFMEWLSTADAAKGWIEAGGFISPNKGVSLDWYPNDVDRTQAEILQNASTLRFDASDLMPAEVGTGTFWTGMVDWISGDDLDTVLQDIEDSWPQ